MNPRRRSTGWGPPRGARNRESKGECVDSSRRTRTRRELGRSVADSGRGGSGGAPCAWGTTLDGAVPERNRSDEPWWLGLGVANCRCGKELVVCAH